MRAPWVSGDVFIRPNGGRTLGFLTPGHAHNFGHTTFFQAGWHLARRSLPGRELIQQFCSPEYRITRALQAKYEPHTLLRPIRFADTLDENGRPQFALQFILPGEAVAEGGAEILFAPAGFHALIDAAVLHEFASLTDDAHYSCVYTHREPDGTVTQIVNGWAEAYQ